MRTRAHPRCGTAFITRFTLKLWQNAFGHESRITFAIWWIKVAITLALEHTVNIEHATPFNRIG
jgi:hypothetical protein